MGCALHLQNFQLCPPGTEAIPAYYAARVRKQKLLERNGQLAFADNHFPGCGWRHLILPYLHPTRTLQ